MKFQDHFDKMVWTLITGGIITLIGLVGTVGWTALNQVRMGGIIKDMNERLVNVEIYRAVQEALAEERNKPKEN